MGDDDDFKVRIGRLFDRHRETRDIASNVTRAMQERSEQCLLQFRDRLQALILPTLRDAQDSTPEAKRVLTVRYHDGTGGMPAMALIETKFCSLEFRADLTLCKVEVYREINRSLVGPDKPEMIALLQMEQVTKELVEHYVEEFIALALRVQRL